MKRTGLEKLRDELTEQLQSTAPDITVEVQLYGDVDEHGAVLTVGNDDMERDEVHADAIYVEAYDS